jgi:hypothetical protein
MTLKYAMYSRDFKFIIKIIKSFYIALFKDKTKSFLAD